jgi:hypothetical protein
MGFQEVDAGLAAGSRGGGKLAGSTGPHIDTAVQYRLEHAYPGLSVGIPEGAGAGQPYPARWGEGIWNSSTGS